MILNNEWVNCMKYMLLCQAKDKLNWKMSNKTWRRHATLFRTNVNLACNTFVIHSLSCNIQNCKLLILYFNFILMLLRNIFTLLILLNLNYYLAKMYYLLFHHKIIHKIIIQFDTTSTCISYQCYHCLTISWNCVIKLSGYIHLNI